MARKKLREMSANDMEAEASGTVFSHSQSELVEASTSLLTTSAATGQFQTLLQFQQL